MTTYAEPKWFLCFTRRNEDNHNESQQNKSQQHESLQRLDPLSDKPLSNNNSLSRSPVKTVEPAKSADQSRAQMEYRGSFEGLPGREQVYPRNHPPSETKHKLNSNGAEAVGLDEIKVELPGNNLDNDSTNHAASQLAAT